MKGLCFKLLIYSILYLFICGVKTQELKQLYSNSVIHFETIIFYFYCIPLLFSQNLFLIILSIFTETKVDI